MKRILLVEDMLDCQILVQEALSQQFDILVANTADEAESLLVTNTVNLIILDITLPEKDGYTFLAQLQSDPKTAQIPVICLSSRNELTDKVTAFSLGVDDYIVKPFNLIELRARVEAKIRKTQRAIDKDDVVTFGNLTIDRGRHAARITEGIVTRDLELTPTEFKLLFHLAKQPDRVFSRNQLLVAVWGDDSSVFDRTVDVHISSLRRKLGDLSHQIVAVSGVGYKMSNRSSKAKKAQ